MSVLETTQTFLGSLTLDELGQARAAIALALAAKMDQAVSSESAGVAQSVAGISKELRETLTVLQLAKGEAETLLDDLGL